jgi:hypothetical protein
MLPEIKKSDIMDTSKKAFFCVLKALSGMVKLA